MTNQEFYYWLAGFYQLEQPSDLTAKQLNIIRNHLNLVKEVEGVWTGFSAELNLTLQKFADNKDESTSAYSALTQVIHELLMNNNI